MSPAREISAYTLFQWVPCLPCSSDSSGHIEVHRELLRIARPVSIPVPVLFGEISSSALWLAKRICEEFMSMGIHTTIVPPPIPLTVHFPRNLDHPCTRCNFLSPHRTAAERV